MRPTESPASHDGRIRRGATNRERILQAIYEIVRSGRVRPTAEEVAARAQVGLRTVFRHFADMETLRADLKARVEAEVRPMLLETVAPADTLEERVRALCRRRARIFEHIAPFRRARRIHRPDADPDPGLEQLNVFLREDLVRSLAPDLDTRRGSLVEALDSATSFEAWDRLRTVQRLGRQQATRAMETGILAMLRGAS